MSTPRLRPTMKIPATAARNWSAASLSTVRVSSGGEDRGDYTPNVEASILPTEGRHERGNGDWQPPVATFGDTL